MLRVVFADKNLIPEDIDLGSARQDLGTHSNRKGAATYLCGLAVCLSVVAIYLRAGWSVGKVQDQYIFPEQAVIKLLDVLLLDSQ